MRVLFRSVRIVSGAIRTDSVRTDLAGEVLRQNFYTGLGGCIRDRRHRIGPARRGRRNRNDVPCSALLHARQEAFNREEGRSEIAVDRCSPLLLTRLLDWAGRGEAAAGIGDEDVERPEFPFNPTRMASISLNLVTSAVTSMASPPACTMSASTADSASTSLPCSATFAPWRANRAAIAAPMPRELPVTRAILSFKRSILVARSQRH